MFNRLDNKKERTSLFTILFLVILCSFLSPALLGTEQNAFGTTVVTDPPDLCRSLIASPVDSSHSLSISSWVSSSHPIFTATASNPVLNTVIFWLDGVSQQLTYNGAAPFTADFGSLSPGSHTVVICYYTIFSSSYHHSDKITFEIPSPTPIPEFPFSFSLAIIFVSVAVVYVAIRQKMMPNFKRF